ncbi:Uncharacterised protein [Staphylococcus aureus]|nr:Uncharacterised protein [Staphylococcus aureus]
MSDVLTAPSFFILSFVVFLLAFNSDFANTFCSYPLVKSLDLSISSAYALFDIPNAKNIPIEIDKIPILTFLIE